ncbi:hypothetical protein BC941DRAFT_500603 [Chlamydoabsidia padenii]|nr:hypothetical protein BC941DRAFT_500603 [Chlamydoabsidia padenii]
MTANAADPSPSNNDTHSTTRNLIPLASTSITKETRKLPHDDEHDKKEHTKLIEQKVRQLLLWSHPIQTSICFVLAMTGLYVSASYSFIQVISALLTLTIGINLVYVNLAIQTSRIFAGHTGSNPYSAYLYDTKIVWMDRTFLRHNTLLIADKLDPLLQKLIHILLIDNSAESAKWFGIFYASWNLTTIISFRTLATLGVLMLFSLPSFYTHNKNFVDSLSLQLEAIRNTYLDRLQEIIEYYWGKFTGLFQIPQSGSSPSPSLTINGLEE